MKKNIWMASALVCALAVATVSCSNEELAGTTPDADGQRTTITANTPQSGADTRISYDETDAAMKLAWEASDAIGVWQAGQTSINEFTTATAGASTDFTSTGDVSFTTGDQLYAVYPKPSAVTAANVATIDLSAAQTGALNNAYHYMHASAQWQAEGTANFNFRHAVSILKLTLNFAGVSNAPNTLTDITLSATGLHNKATLTMNSATGEIAGTNFGNITATGTFTITSSTTNVYLYVFPEELKDISIVATDGTNTYAGTLTDKTVIAGKVYTATITMGAPGKLVGDLLLKDGTTIDIKTMTDAQKSDCVGIVFWVNPKDRTHGKAVSLDESISTLTWGSIGEVHTNDKNDGAVNMTIIQAISGWESAYQVFKWCADHPAVDGKSWYLPAIGEVQAITPNLKALNAVLTTYDSKITPLVGYWWTSTEFPNDPANKASIVGPTDGKDQSGYSQNGIKTLTKNIRTRAVLAF